MNKQQGETINKITEIIKQEEISLHIIFSSKLKSKKICVEKLEGTDAVARYIDLAKQEYRIYELKFNTGCFMVSLVRRAW